MRTLEHAIERAERRGLFDLAELQALLRRNRGSPGSGSLRAALDAYVEPAFTRSELERTFVELVRKAGLPTPSVNAVVAGYEVDILWRAERFGVELDTYEFHGTRAAFERDRRRHEDLKFQGIEIVRVTGQRIDRERELVVRRIGELLNRRRRETSGDG
jgi:very-short-patch-repair endonuclease